MVSATEAGMLTEINDGSRGARPEFDSLGAKGLITRVTYANGEHVELTDLAHALLDEWEHGDYSRIIQRKSLT